MIAWGVLVLCAAALAAPVVDPFAEPDDSALYRQEERIVTVAARYAQAVEDAPAIVTVVTDREIRERGYRTLADLLSDLPGVYVSTSEESRSLAAFRGVSAPDNNKVLVLVDGLPLFDGVYGHAWLDGYFPLDHVKQVEVIKGPGSAVHGTNAFAGVINVVTYAPEDLTGGFARFTVGNGFTVSASAVGGGPFRIGRVAGGVMAWARVLDTEGDGLDWTPRARRNVSGDDPESGVAGGLRLRIDGLDLRLDAYEWRHTYFVNEQDDPIDVLTQSPENFWLKYHDLSASAAWAFRGEDLVVTPRVAVRRHDDPGQYGWFDDPTTTAADDGTLTTTWNTTLVETFKTTAFARAEVDMEWRPGAAHVFVAGLGGELVSVLRIEDVYYTDRAHEAADGYLYEAPRTDIPTGWVYAQDTWTLLPWLEATVGARLDAHGFFGVFPSPRVGVLLVPTDAVVVKLLYGRAFRAPTARELLVEVEADADGNNLFTSGNPDLRPEQVNTAEVEVQVRPADGLRLRAAGFYSAVSDQIDRRLVDTPVPELGDLYYDNFGGTSIFGVEADVSGRWGPVRADAAYAFTSATDTDTGRAVYEFPPHTGRVRVGAELERLLRAYATINLIGERPREEWAADTGLEDGKAVALLDLSLATDPIAERVSVDVGVTNVVGTRWATLISRDDANTLNGDEAKYPRDVSQEGRMVRVGIEVGF